MVTHLREEVGLSSPWFGTRKDLTNTGNTGLEGFNCVLQFLHSSWVHFDPVVDPCQRIRRYNHR